MSALLNNFATAESVVETATNATGSAAKENAKYLDSVEGKISQFSASIEQLSETIINSEVIKFFVDAGTNIIDILDKIIDRLGTLPALGAAIGPIITGILNVRGITNPAFGVVKNSTGESVGINGASMADLGMMTKAIYGGSSVDSIKDVFSIIASGAKSIAMSGDIRKAREQIDEYNSAVQISP